MIFWKNSKLRFYIKNIIWNYSFWIRCKRTYVDYSFVKTNPINGKREKVIKRRFIGYNYKGKLYQDNPGMPISSKNDWKFLKKNYINKTH
tara:strand:- start:9932 stop:10201 length:270 start_codon:yes stop_codon:yes gene_type:complete